MCLGGRAGHAAIPGDVGEVHHFAVAQCRGVQKVGEGRQVSHKALGGNLLSQVVRDVCVEHAPGPARSVHPRKVAMIQHPVEVEVGAQLPRGQAVHFVTERAPAQEIRRAAPHFSRARPAHREMETSVLDQPVYLVQQRRRLLHLVYHDLPRGFRRLGFQLLPEQLRPRCVPAQLVALEQVNAARVWIYLPEQGALPYLARAP